MPTPIPCTLTHEEETVMTIELLLIRKLYNYAEKPQSPISGGLTKVIKYDNL